jgi:hypothetical protein
MLRRFLVLGVGWAALLWTLAPGHLQAQHGGHGGGGRGVSRSISSGVGRQFNRTGASSRFGGFNGGFDRRFSGSGIGGFNRGFDGRFSGSGFGSGFGLGYFSPGYGGFGPGFTTPIFPPTDQFGRPLFLPRSSGY